MTVSGAASGNGLYTTDNQDFVKVMVGGTLNSQLTTSVNKDDLGIANGQTAFYLAPYETPKSIILGKLTDQYAIWGWVDKGTMVDGGPHPWDPMIAEWQAGIAMAAQAKFSNSKFQKQILELASQQVLMASETLSKTILSSNKEAAARKEASGM